MRVLSLRNTAIILAAGIGLSGCATYGQYGGLGVGVGYGSGGYGYDPYYGGGYGSYGYNSPYGYNSYAYGNPYYGWYDGFYYPGSGYYVYDQYRNRHRWSDTQRAYWEQRQRTYRDRNRVGFLGENWREFHRDDANRTQVSSKADGLRSRELTRTYTGPREQNRVERQTTRTERSQSWTDRRRAQAVRASTRESRRESHRRSRDD